MCLCFSTHPSTSPVPTQISTSFKTNNKAATLTSESPVFSPRILQLPKIDQIHADRRKKSRKVSFTQIDLNELEIPKPLMHSSDALEKYKFNPHYYLPDGTIKAKFLLPQLKDTIESVKDCRYIRQFSMENDEQIKNNYCDSVDFDIVRYVFHDEEAPTIN